jgi:hypothetical protein
MYDVFLHQIETFSMPWTERGATHPLSVQGVRLLRPRTPKSYRRDYARTW